ncbi:MAG: hypothetical protein CV088_04110 [Nitrospira sp. LK70]|nr:hypothetical protein [Nitrospira sp. LK70]
MSRLKLWVGMIVLFGAGVATGSVGTSLYADAERMHRGERGPAAQHERIMKRLTQGLSLTTQQQLEIEPIVGRAHVAILDLRFSHQGEIEQILSEGMADIKGKLSTEQQSELDKMYAGLQQRWQLLHDYLDAHKKGTMP